jgi:DNA-binding GntR family transcriptional regulator
MKAEPVRINDVVYRVLHRNLLDGSISNEVRIRETDVARLLEVSRVPARVALARLAEEGLISPAAGRGYVRAGGETGAGRQAPGVLEITVSPEEREELGHRNWRQRLFDNLEIEIGAALPYGTFRIAESRLADHLGVSRTVAREFLSRLDRAGIVQQLPNGRWQAGPLGVTDIGHHYAMRQVLEPLALAAVADELPRDVLEQLAGALQDASTRLSSLTVEEILRLERDLHVDIVLRTPNPQMADAIRRSQLPLLSTHVSLDTAGSERIIFETISDHQAIAAALLDGEGALAARRLQQHLVRGEAMTYERLSRIDPEHAPHLPEFLERQ